MKLLYVWLMVCGISIFAACSKDSDPPLLRQQQYELKPWGSSGISGTAFVSENLDNSFNITVVLNKSVKDTIHIMNVINGTESSQGNVAFKLTDVKGTGGSVAAETRNIGQFVQATGSSKSLSYDEILTYKAFIKVRLSENLRDSILCVGKIGL